MNSMFVHLLCEIMILSRASSTNSSEFNIHNMRQTIGSIYLVRDPELEMLYASQKKISGIKYGTTNPPLMPGKAHLF